MLTDEVKGFGSRGIAWGGSNATITAARLHYDEGIPVQGLHTFGTPKVGDSNFQKLFTNRGANRSVLLPRVRRWAVEGDHASTLFRRDVVRWGVVIYYQHVGQTNHIFQTRSGASWIFDVNYDAVDRSNIMFAPPWSLWNPNPENAAHGMYTAALRSELTRELNAQNRPSALSDILEAEYIGDLFEFLDQ